MEEKLQKLPSIADNIVSAFDVIMNRADMNHRFVFSGQAFWQALITGWIMGIVVIVLPSFKLGVYFLSITALSSLISVLLYALVIWHILQYSQRSDRFERFLVPYFWVGNLQIVLFGLILIIGQMISPMVAQIATLPIIIWILVWLYRIARRQLAIGGMAAIGIVMARYAVEAGLALMVAQGISPVSGS